MSDKKVILPSEDKLIEKWLPVIELKDKWADKIGDAPKVPSKQYGLMAQQLEILEQCELSEATTTSSISTYVPVLIPMVRRVLPALIGNEIFGTQPMSGPSQLIFALKSVYTHTSATPIAPKDGVILTLADASGFAAGEGISSTADAAVGTVRYKEGNNILVEMTSGAFVVGVAVDDASTFSTGLSTVSAIYTDAEAMAPFIFPSYSGSYTTATGEALTTDMKEMGFEIISNSVTAKTRKLKSKWTLELEDDLRAIHGMSAESLLTDVCSSEIIREMNREFIEQVKTYAATTTDFGLATSTFTYDTSDDTQGRWEYEKYQSLANKIDRQRQALAKSCLRGQATFAIVTPKIRTALQSIGMLPRGGDEYANTYVGDFNGMRIYVDLFGTETTDAVYFGYKGASEIDAGMFFCPYVPLKINKGVGDDDNIPRLFFSTRYGLAENPYGAKNYYHKLTVSSMP